MDKSIKPINDMRGIGAVMLLALAAILILSASVISASHQAPGTTECDFSAMPAGCYIVDFCHYSCADVPLFYMQEVPSRPGPELQNTIVNVSLNLYQAETLRREGNPDILLEGALEAHYQEILRADPDNFWANWDYAQLRASQEDYTAADKLYYNAVSTLEPETRKEIVQDLKIPAVEKWKLNEVKPPSPETSPFLKELGNSLIDAVGLREPLITTTGYEEEQLTWKAKLAKQGGICGDASTCNQCVTGIKAVGGCIVDSFINPLGVTRE